MMVGKGIHVQEEDLPTGKFAKVKLRVQPKIGRSIEDVASHFASLWSSDLAADDAFRTRVIGEPNDRAIEFAIPVSLLRPELGITQLLNILTVPAEYDQCDRMMVENIVCPQAALAVYQGPRLGVDGLRQTFAVPNGPIIGAILKPRLIRDLDAVFDTIKDLAPAGLDFLVDDELMIETAEAPFDRRVSKSVDLLRRHQASSKATEFVANVTARPTQALDFARRAKGHGACAFVTNPIVTGFGALEDLAAAGLGLPIIATNMGAALYAKCGETGASAGLSEAVVGKLARLAGADAVHGGIGSADWYALAPGQGISMALSGGLPPIRQAFRVIAGGLNILSMLDNWPLDAEPVIFEGGSSIFRHPRGAGAGARSFRKAWEVGRQYIRDVEDSRIDAKAKLVALALKDKDLEAAIEAAGPLDNEVIRRSRNHKPKGLFSRLLGG